MTLLRRHAGEGIRPLPMRSRQHKRAIRLTRIVVFQEEDRRLGGLSLGLAAKPALPRLERFRLGDVASAAPDVRPKRRA